MPAFVKLILIINRHLQNIITLNVITLVKVALKYKYRTRLECRHSPESGSGYHVKGLTSLPLVTAALELSYFDSEIWKV